LFRLNDVRPHKVIRKVQTHTGFMTATLIYACPTDGPGLADIVLQNEIPGRAWMNFNLDGGAHIIQWQHIFRWDSFFSTSQVSGP